MIQLLLSGGKFLSPWNGTLTARIDGTSSPEGTGSLSRTSAMSFSHMSANRMNVAVLIMMMSGLTQNRGRGAVTSKFDKPSKHLWDSQRSESVF